MSNMVSVSRPPSIHAPWRKSFIIPLFTIQLGLALLQGVWGVTRGAVSIYLGTDTGMRDDSERLHIGSGVVGLIAVCIVIWHIVLFSLFRLTAQTFLRGNIVIVVLSLIMIVIGIVISKRVDRFLVDDDPYSAIFAGVMCFISLWVTVYSALVWRRVNAGRARDMSRPRSELGAGGKGLDATVDAIPMV